MTPAAPMSPGSGSGLLLWQAARPLEVEMTMTTTVVRYQAKPDRAEENQRLIETVFAELNERELEGFTYKVFLGSPCPIWDRSIFSIGRAISSRPGPSKRPPGSLQGHGEVSQAEKPWPRIAITQRAASAGALANSSGLVPRPARRVESSVVDLRGVTGRSTPCLAW